MNFPEIRLFSSKKLYSRCSNTRCNDFFEYYIIVEDEEESSLIDVPKFCDSCQNRIDINKKDQPEFENIIKTIFTERIKEKSELEKIKDQLNSYYQKEVIKNTYEI